MILAAGEGRRLRPLTLATPKALIEVAGVPLLERVARAAIASGAHRLLINAHHRADQIEAFVEARRGFGVPFVIVREDAVSTKPLETGGALVHAGGLFQKKEPFLLHNADIATDLDLGALYRSHVEGEAADGRLATLAVMERETTRPLLIDDRGVYGRANREEGWERVARPPRDEGDGREGGGQGREVGFAGIHVLSHRIFALLTERGTFSLIDAYMRLVGDGHLIATYDASGVVWHDIGTPEKLEAARDAFRPQSSAR